MTDNEDNDPEVAFVRNRKVRKASAEHAPDPGVVSAEWEVGDWLAVVAASGEIHGAELAETVRTPGYARPDGDTSQRHCLGAVSCLRICPAARQ